MVTKQVKVPKQPKASRQSGGGGGGGSPVYGLGVLGAAIWYWNRSDDPKDRAMGLLKALVWPAFLVHEALESLDR
jgi:hypothetical protein